MKVSILIPVYGVERYVAQCARTLMEQTYQDIEYIFVNDCTPDCSIDVLHGVVNQYPERKSQVVIIDHEINKGLASARQTALDAASGEALLIVDSDDYVATDAVELLVAKMQQSGCDIVDGGYAVVSNGEQTSEHNPLHLSDEGYLKTILCQNVEPNRIWGRLIKKSLFEQHNIAFHPGVNYGEDFSVLPLLLLYARRGWVDKAIYYYRDDNAESYTNNVTLKNSISFLKARQIVGNYLINSPEWSEFSFAAQLGWVDVWRFARRFGVSKDVVNEHFTLSPSHFVPKILTSLMRSSLPYGFANFVYKAVRKIYLLFAV